MRYKASSVPALSTKQDAPRSLTNSIDSEHQALPEQAMHAQNQRHSRAI